MSQNKQEFNIGSTLYQSIFDYTRLILFVLILYYFTTQYAALFHQIAPLDLTENLIASHPGFQYWPRWLVTWIACLTTRDFIRYAIAPLFAMLTVLLAGALYVKDVYALPGYGYALRYVIASMFPFGAPTLKVDKGVKQITFSEVNLLDAIGGPGAALVEPGSAAIFRHLRAPSGLTIGATRVLAPFETISDTIDLAEQQCDKDEVGCVTRDGIKISLRDVHFRYRIKSDRPKDAPILSGVYYPSEKALTNRAYNLSVQDSELESWNSAVEGKIVAAITDFIGTRSLDYLTAPRENDQDPRQALLDNLFRSAPNALDSLGAELIWADFGHMEIVEEQVDDQRASQWAVDWIGDASLARAYGDAKRQAYQEMGRAEAQAEMIISIAESLRAANLSGKEKPENLRKILLARTAQVLDSIGAMRKNGRGE